MRERTAADDVVQGAYNRALLGLILEPMRIAAKDVGYAITVHGSLNRDVDLVAIPWREHNVADPDRLMTILQGVICGITGRCHREQGWTQKPHGRLARIISVWCGESTCSLDLSVMPPVPEKENEDA